MKGQSYYLFLVLIFLTPQWAQAQIERRTNLAKKITSVQTEKCLADSKMIKSSTDLAATYVMHGEMLDAKQALQEATKSTKAPVCKQALRELQEQF